MAVTVKYASSSEGGNCASTIGWIDFSDISSVTSIPQLITNEIPGGYTITFNVSTSEEPQTMTPGEVPLIANAAFGNTGYAGFPDGSNVGLLSSSDTVVFNINDITIRNSTGETIKNYTIVAANAETTNLLETWSVVTDGSDWALLDKLPPVSGSAVGPTITGLGSTTVTEVGIEETGSVNAPIIETNSPKNLIFNLTTTDTGNEGVAIGVLINQTVSCNLDAEITNENKMIYVTPGSPQYFKASINKCCGGTATIVYCGDNFNQTTGRIEGELGEYQVVGSGIVFYPNMALVDGTMDILTFEVSDGCNTSELTVAVVYSRCKSCMC